MKCEHHIGIRVETKLLKAIKKAASESNRTVSGWARLILQTECNGIAVERIEKALGIKSK